MSALVSGDWDEISNEDQIERVVNVVRVLTNMTYMDIKQHFDMKTWGAHKEGCGTVACAAGTCGLDPWFRERGFKLDFAKVGDGIDADLNREPDEFFGSELHERVFVNTEFMTADPFWSYVGVLTEVLDILEEMGGEA